MAQEIETKHLLLVTRQRIVGSLPSVSSPFKAQEDALRFPFAGEIGRYFFDAMESLHKSHNKRYRYGNTCFILKDTYIGKLRFRNFIPHYMYHASGYVEVVRLMQEHPALLITLKEGEGVIRSEQQIFILDTSEDVKAIVDALVSHAGQSIKMRFDYENFIFDGVSYTISLDYYPYDHSISDNYVPLVLEVEAMPSFLSESPSTALQEFTKKVISYFEDALVEDIVMDARFSNRSLSGSLHPLEESAMRPLPTPG